MSTAMVLAVWPWNISKSGASTRHGAGSSRSTLSGSVLENSPQREIVTTTSACSTSPASTDWACSILKCVVDSTTSTTTQMLIGHASALPDFPVADGRPLY